MLRGAGGTCVDVVDVFMMGVGVGVDATFSVVDGIGVVADVVVVVVGGERKISFVWVRIDPLVSDGHLRVPTSRRIRIGSWNVGSLTGKLFELADVTARNGVGVILATGLKDNVVQVIRRSDRIMKITLFIDKETVHVISAYAPQVGRSEEEKKSFWDSLNELVKECRPDQRLIIGGDLNGHIGAATDGYAGVHRGFGFGVRNDEGRLILEFATAHDLVVANSFFKKRDVHLITFESGGHNTQIDYLVVRRSDLRACRDCRVFPGETCSSQHKLLALDTIFERPQPRRVAFRLPRILWKTLGYLGKDGIGILRPLQHRRTEGSWKRRNPAASESYIRRLGTRN
ncbi:hypothetical protein CTI12_AA615940 [Artemisia annua]|uniref:Craniofacial development protein 2 n=1 Tax=Artemisia annua TaxID=35608 RepID=A0A2U1KDB1_ARTAN|nr:hypothetical protein CTI12_AA615940 [Artemisia annua]